VAEPLESDLRRCGVVDVAPTATSGPVAAPCSRVGHCLIPSPFGSVTVSPSPQLQIEEEEKLHALRKYARDFRCQHMTDAEDFHWDSEDEDYGLAIGHLVIT
jgi:hypothetical protein